MVDNTCNRFMIRRAEGMRRTIVDSDDETANDDNPLFGQINGAPRCVISFHVSPTKKISKKRDGTETRYLLQDKCEVFRKNTTHVCSDCEDKDAFRNEIWVCHPKKNRFCLAQHVHSTHDP